MFKRAYVEITNVCNLQCSFCPGTKRAPEFMDVETFKSIAKALRPHTAYLYLHVMGEPLLHPQLGEILKIADELGFQVNITTNGTLIHGAQETLLNAHALRKVSISLHSFEGNHGQASNELVGYLDCIWDFCQATTSLVALRLWNGGGAERLNGFIIDYLNSKVGKDIRSLPINNGSRTIAPHLYLENAEMFDWPSLEADACDVSFCHGLSQQIGVLVDGTVIPCCLDSNGTINLGNLLESSLDEILVSERVKDFMDGFTHRKPSEELCRHCGYATRFKH